MDLTDITNTDTLFFEEGVSPPIYEKPFLPLFSVKTNVATARDVSNEYVRQNLKRGLLKLQDLPGFMQIKGADNPIVLIGAGPSLNRPEVLAELKEMTSKYPSIACGSIHDWCIDHDIIPTYCTAVDPDNIVLRYMRKPHKDTIYLMASQCSTEVFDFLKEYKVYIWHCYSTDMESMLKEIDPNYIGIGGGCTVALRSINIGIIMGYSNIHIFGMDTCLGENDKFHVFNLKGEDEHAGFGKERYTVRLGLDGPTSKTYRCLGYHLAQMTHFKELYTNHAKYFTPTFHGGGTLAEIMEIFKQDEARHFPVKVIA